MWFDDLWKLVLLSIWVCWYFDCVWFITYLVGFGFVDQLGLRFVCGLFCCYGGLFVLFVCVVML